MCQALHSPGRGPPFGASVFVVAERFLCMKKTVQTDRIRANKTPLCGNACLEDPGPMLGGILSYLVEPTKSKSGVDQRPNILCGKYTYSASSLPLRVRTCLR